MIPTTQTSPPTTPRSLTPPPRDRSIPMDTDDELSPPPRPDDLQESSIADADPVGVSATTTTGAITYTIAWDTSIRGKDKLFDSDGYAYTVKRSTARCITRRCTLRSKKINCTATVRQLDPLLWSALDDTSTSRVKVRRFLQQSHTKRNCRRMIDLFQSAGEIVGDLVAECVAATQPCPALERMAANVNYHQRRHRPQHPQDLAFPLYVAHIPDDFLRRDVKVDDARHLLFATSLQIDLLDKAKTCYVDATFYVVRQPFQQLFTINAFVRQDDCTKQLPLAMCVKSRRRKRDYVAIFREMAALLPHRRLQRMVLDFENATWRAARVVFPTLMFKGCAFHFTQVIWRRVQECGLQVAYGSDAHSNFFGE